MTWNESGETEKSWNFNRFIKSLEALLLRGS